MVLKHDATYFATGSNAGVILSCVFQFHKNSSIKDAKTSILSFLFILAGRFDNLILGGDHLKNISNVRYLQHPLKMRHFGMNLLMLEF